MNSIEQLARRPVLLGPSRAAVSLSGVVPRQVVSLRTSGDAEVLTGPPAGDLAGHVLGVAGLAAR